MRSKDPRLIFLAGCLLLSGLTGVCWPQNAIAQSVTEIDADTDEAPSLFKLPKMGIQPLVVVNLSGIEQARSKLETLFEIAEHPETLDTLWKQVTDATGGLAGVDQTRPAGLAVFMDALFPPSFEFVAFAPMTDTEEFMRTLELGPVIASPVAGETGRYELIGPDNTSQVRIENGYAFIQLPILEPDEAFDRPLPDPLTLLDGITSQFDASVMLDVESVPKPTRQLIVNFITSTMSTQMQQRDEEADGLYEMRRAWMQADIDGFKLLLDECRRISIGLSIDEERRVANVDFAVDVREGSDLLNEILNSTTKPSYFLPLLNDNAAVSVSLSQIMPQRDRDRYVGALEGLKKELARQVDLNNLGTPLDNSSPVFGALSALQETFSEGHFDAFGQCYEDVDENLVVVGALRVTDGQMLAGGLADMLGRLSGEEWASNLEIGCAEHAGIQFHRVNFGNSNPELNAVLGDNPGLVFGSGPRSLWVGLGGSNSIDTVKAVIDELTASYENPTEYSASAGIRVIVNALQLIRFGEKARNSAGRQDSATVTEGTELIADGTSSAALQESSGSERRRRREEFAGARREMWRETLAEGGDRIRMEVLPSKRGTRFRIQFGEAYLRGIGRGITMRVEEGD